MATKRKVVKKEVGWVKEKKRTFHRERVVKKFKGLHVTPKVVAEYLGTDRAAACRILQSLVLRREATRGVLVGEYKVTGPVK